MDEDRNAGKRAQRALRASERKYHSLFDSMLDGYAHCRMIYDEQGRPADFVYLDVNESFATLTGLSDVAGKRVSEVIPGIRESNPELFEIYGRAALTGEKRRFETYVESLGIWFSIAVYSPRKHHFVAVFENITERKRVEEALRRLTAELEDRVTARTADLEAANQELKAFSYSVSHDLRAPLRALDGFSRLLLSDYSAVLDEQGRDYLRRVRGAAQKMGTLIDDFLRLYRVTSDEMNLTTVNLSELVLGAVAELRQAAPARRVSVTVQPGLTVRGDERLLRVAIANLLDNAWKFTAGEKEARIEFGAVSATAGGRDATAARGALQYFLRDNGAGFDNRYADAAFQPFQRLHAESEYPGSGIGLAIVKRVVARHGGSVAAEGVPGEGATFTFSLGDPSS